MRLCVCVVEIMLQYRKHCLKCCCETLLFLTMHPPSGVVYKVTGGKARKCIFPHCKTSCGHNSGSIKHRVMKFACSIGFSTTADRMVWSPPLSRDRKWPRVTKCTHSRVVGLRLEGNRVCNTVVLCEVWFLPVSVHLHIVDFCLT